MPSHIVWKDIHKKVHLFSNMKAEETFIKNSFDSFNFSLLEVFSFEDTHFPKSMLIFLYPKLFRQMLGEPEIQIAWIYCTEIETVLAILKSL